ncbi:MAG: hypothetical protein ACTIC1_18655 [Brevibacterium sp.]
MKSAEASALSSRWGAAAGTASAFPASRIIAGALDATEVRTVLERD